MFSVEICVSYKKICQEMGKKIWERISVQKSAKIVLQQDDNGHAVLTAKIYCTFVCFVDLFQSILMYGGQRLQLKDTSREGAVGKAVALVCVYMISEKSKVIFT